MIRQNFIYPEIKKTDYLFGTNKFSAVPLRDNGDWRPYLTPEEYQNKNGIESSACYIEAQQHAIAIIQEEQFNLPDKNYSARFNALLSGGTPYGGDPLVGAESIRKLHGLIPDDMMPFNDEIQSWNDYHSFKGVNEKLCMEKGKQFLDLWRLNYDIVFTREDNLEDKFAKLRLALQYSPCPISVYGMTDGNGNYVEKPQGANDTHLTLAVAVEPDNSIWVFDTYFPFLKKLPANYNSDFGMRWGLGIIEREVKKNYWTKFINWLVNLFK